MVVGVAVVVVVGVGGGGRRKGSFLLEELLLHPPCALPQWPGVWGWGFRGAMAMAWVGR